MEMSSRPRRPKADLSPCQVRNANDCLAAISVECLLWHLAQISPLDLELLLLKLGNAALLLTN